MAILRLRRPREMDALDIGVDFFTRLRLKESHRKSTIGIRLKSIGVIDNIAGFGSYYFRKNIHNIPLE